MLYTEFGTKQVVSENDLLFWEKNKLMILENLEKCQRLKAFLEDTSL